jgi:alcohol dehydrogenase
VKVRAAVLGAMGAKPPFAQSKPLSIEDIDLESPGKDEVLVRIAAAGLCHSDLSVINGDRPRPTPMVLGHEAAGVVEEPGLGVEDLKTGDHVALVFVPSCGHCVPCAEGRPALCEPAAAANVAGTLLSGAKRIAWRGNTVNHHLGVSAFAEYATVSRRSLVKIDPALPLAEAALFGCAVLTGVGAVVNTARVSPGASVGIVGMGGVGLAALLGAALAGAGRIAAIDVAPDKLALARQLGATESFDAGGATAAEDIRSATSGGFDYVFEMAGSAKALDLAYRVTRRGGMTVTAGLPHPDSRVSLSPAQMVIEERNLRGSYYGSSVPARDIPRYIALYRQGKLPIDRLMSERLTLDEVNLGFDRLASGKTVRQLVVF